MYRSIALLALVAAPAFAFVAPIAPMTRMASSRVHMSAKTDAILEELKTLTLMEAAELVKGIEEAFGVDASASSGGMMMAAPVAAAPAEAAEAQTEFDVILDSFPADKKIAVLKVVRTMTGLGLKEAKDLVEAVPKSLKAGVSKAEADDIIKQIEEAGGKCIAK